MAYFEIDERFDTTKEPAYEVNISRFYISTDYSGDPTVYAIVEIKNTDEHNIYLKDCVFDLEDDDGHLLQTEDFISSCPDIIAPGESGYFYTNYEISLDEASNTENGINLVPAVTVQYSKEKPTTYDVSDVSFQEGSYGPTVTGRVTNTSEKDDSLFYIQVIYFDANGTPIAILGTNLTDFSAGKTASFEISGYGLPDDVTMDAIAEYKIIAQASSYQY